MRTQTLQKVELFARALSTIVLGVFAIFVFTFLGSILRPSAALAVTSTSINFQARLETSSGGIVPDGNYNVEFKLYNSSTSSGSSQGSCTGDANCLWTETRINANQVRVANGYLTVNLGSVAAFPATINWNQQLWLGMNIGGTAVTPTWDGEMSPRLLLTASPYAFQAGTLSTTNGSNVATLSFTTPTATDSILLPDASGTVCLQNASACGFAPATGGTGYVQLQASSPGTQQTGNFNISGIGIANNLEAAVSIQAPLVDTLTASALGIGTTNATSINLNQNTVVANNKSFTANGAAIFKDATNSTTAFQVQNASASALFTGDTTNMRLGVDATYSSMTTPSSLAASPASGGSLTAGTYKYEVTAVDSAGGETTVSNEATGTTSGGNLTLSLTWAASTSASGYKVYRTASGGGSGTEKYLATILTNSYGDTGSVALGAASPPGSNSAYISTNVTNKSLELTVGGNGSPTGQFYVGGNIPASSLNAVSPTNNPLAVYAQGGYAYVISYNNGLFVYDINNPAAPVKVGSVSTGNIGGACTHNALYVQGRYAYVTNCLTNTLSVVDISNPSSPIAVGSVSTGSSPFALYVQGRYAYVTNNGSNTMTVYDVSNPASPVSVGSVSTGASSGPEGVYVQGRYAYVTNNTSNTLSVIDVSNPMSPSSVVNFSTGAGTSPYPIYVQGRYAYVGDTNDNVFHVYDVSNPASPVSVGSASGIGFLPTSISVQGRYAYIGYSTSNLVGVYDVSNPASPVSVGSMTATGNVTSVFAKGRYVYAIDDNNSFLDVFDVGGGYIQQLQAGGVETGTLQADSNATINGDAAVQGGLQVGSSAALGGNLGVNGSSFFQGAVGIASGIQGGATVNGISTPGAPTITPTGTAGSTSYSYAVVAVSAAGGTTPASSAGSTTTGNATLTTSNYNAITWSPVTGAVSYNIYRTVSGGTPSSTGLIGSTSAVSFNDTGIAGTTAAPTLDTSGLLTLNGALQFSGTVTANFTTPQGNTKATKINIPLYDPGSTGVNIISFGLPITANTNSRAITIYDGRTSTSQPTLAISSPDENNVIGLGWNGSNTTADLETVGTGSPGINILNGGTTVASFTTGLVSFAEPLTLSGTNQVNYTTPQGSTIPTKINIPNFNPGNFAQIQAMGLPSTAPTSARVITFFDQRSSTHQPSIDLFSPDENQYGGLSWDGANTTLYFKSSQGIALSTGDANTNTHNAIAIDGSQATTFTPGNTSGDSFGLSNSLLSGGNANLSHLTFKNNNSGAGNTINGMQIDELAAASPSSGTNTSNLLHLGGNAGGTVNGIDFYTGMTNGINFEPGLSFTNYINGDNFKVTGSGTLTVATALQAPLLDTSTNVALNIGTTNATAINLNQNTTVANNKSFKANGSALFEDATNSTTAFQVQNASSASLLDVDTSNGVVNLGLVGSTPSTLGKTAIGTTIGSNYTGLITAQKFTTTTGGPVSSMSTYIGPAAASPNNKYQMAIYADSVGNPGAYIASTNMTTITPNAWNTAAISATLSSSTSYWLVYWTNDNVSDTNNAQYYDPSVSGANWYFATSTWQGGASNGMPTAFPAGTLISNNYEFTIYASFTSTVWPVSISSTGQLTATGSALFGDASNSRTAFQVQNASGSTIFNVDTTNNLVGTPITNTASTNSNNFALATGNAIGSNSTAGNLSIDVGTSTTGNGSILIGGAARTEAITIGNSSANDLLTLQSASTLTVVSSNFNLSSAGVVKLAGGQTSDITTASAGTSNVITIQPGNSTTAAGTGSALTLQGSNQTGTGATTGGNINVDAGSGATGGTVNIGATNASAIQIGKNSNNPSIKLDSGSGTINIGTTGTGHTVNISTAATAANTQTINIGTASTGGITNLNLGSSAVGSETAGTTLLQNLGIKDTLAGSSTSPSDTIQSTTNSTTAFQIQNSSSANLFSVDTTNTKISVNGSQTATLTAFSTGSITTGTTQNRQFESVVSANGYVYILGGSDTGSGSPDALTSVLYGPLNADGSVGTLATTTSLPSARRSGGAAVMNGYIYFYGGIDGGGSRQPTAWYAKLGKDGTVGTWNTTSSLPSAIGAFGTTTANGYIYTVGANGGSVNNAIYYTKPNGDGTLATWTTNANNLPNVNSGTTLGSTLSLVANGYLYAIGGYDSGGGPNAGVFYAKLNSDGSTGTWTTNTNSLADTLASEGGGVMNGYVYTLGGNDNATENPVRAYEYAKLNSDGSTGTWTSVANALPTAEDAPSTTSIVSNGYVYLFGGGKFSDANMQSVIYYASGARLSIAGSLDLLGLTSTNLNGASQAGGSIYAGNIFSNGNLQVTGTAQFANSTTVNSNLLVASSATAAFEVQNTSGTNVLTVDNTNLRVNIGAGSTGETTPSLFVLDSKTGSSSDPTEVDGAMYYNTTLGEFRCGVSGSWEGCVGGLMTSNTSASSAVSNCSTACAAFSKTATLPANYCIAGRVIHITASGVYTNTSGSNATLNVWGLYLGSNSSTRGSDTLIGGQSAASTTIATGTTGEWSMEFNVICDTTGSSGTVTGSGYIILTEPAEYLMALSNTTSPFTSTINTTTSQTLYLFPGFGSANANTTTTLTQLIVTGM